MDGEDSLNFNSSNATSAFAGADRHNSSQPFAASVVANRNSHLPRAAGGATRSPRFGLTRSGRAPAQHRHSWKTSTPGQAPDQHRSLQYAARSRSFERPVQDCRATHLSEASQTSHGRIDPPRTLITAESTGTLRQLRTETRPRRQRLQANEELPLQPRRPAHFARHVRQSSARDLPHHALSLVMDGRPRSPTTLRSWSSPGSAGPRMAP